MMQTVDRTNFDNRARWLRWYFSEFPIEQGKWRLWDRVSDSLKPESPIELETKLTFGMRMNSI